MRDYARAAIDVLRVLRGESYAVAFVELRMAFHQHYGHGLICSTSHGIDFFENILAGPEAWDEEGELGDNFRKLFKLNK